MVEWMDGRWTEAKEERRTDGCDMDYLYEFYLTFTGEDVVEVGCCLCQFCYEGLIQAHNKS